MHMASTQRWKHSVSFNMIEPLLLRVQQQKHTVFSIDLELPQHRILPPYQIHPEIGFETSPTNHTQSLIMAHKSTGQFFHAHNTAGKEGHNIVDYTICLQAYGAVKSASGGGELPCRLPFSKSVRAMCIARRLRESIAVLLAG